MRNVTKTLVSFLKAEDGPTAVVTTLGVNANSTFSFIGSGLAPK